MMTAREIAQNIRDGKITAAAFLQDTLKNIKDKNPSINAFVELFEESAAAQAAAIDAKKAAGKPLGRLAGVPVGIKDNMMYKGHLCTNASKMLQGHRAPYTATVIERLINEDAIIIGRLNMDEFAMGSTNQNSFYGPCKNPLDSTRVPGGSSGASAAAVAAGFVPAALGSDTGGAIRQPAAFCGIVGLKPTYGRVSRSGITAFASSADQVGPLTSNVYDAALMLEVLAGADGKDSTLSNLEVPKYTAHLTKDLKGLKVGIPENFFNNLDAEIKNAFDKSVEVLKSLGAETVSVSLPYAQYSAPCYYILTSAEASSNLSRFDGIRYGFAADASNLEETYTHTRGEGFGKEVKRRIMIGHYVLGKDRYETTILKAHQVRLKIEADFKEAFKKCDVLLTPTTPTTATKIGADTNNPLVNYLADLYTCPGNMADLPGISVNCGFDKDGLPIGLQFYADVFKEENIFKAAHAFEEAIKK